ncbi:TPA: alpha/beta hydrolase [Bacillus thuringiensis]|nr:alpha/beta hydrolase [Bacillus cereus]HDR4799428.1 alpha/beta hydrolase [Bacillus cereus]HDR4805565.1 alpha/beta hydrolase [Bacillus cereus]HDR4811505.1 alpha/beta hydrolase [Bacillus cereus]HDR4833978.1 alpha/beta hydrolase [Bacillus cereus]
MTVKKNYIFKKKILFLVICGLVFLGVSYWFLSPVPRVYIINKAFEKQLGNNAQPSDYNNNLKKVKIVKDINYNSEFPNGSLDIIFPINTIKEKPIIFWMHGGGFIGGDKSQITTYGVELAAHGYTVVSINYALAPKENYPIPLLQLGEAYEFIKKNKNKYDLELNNVYFAGDSAGAQISSQFVTIQTSPEYAKLMGIKAIVEPSILKGVLLFCGPYDVSSLAKMETTKEIEKFLETIGWAYMGKRDWKHLPETKLASILNYVTEDYPPSFITDGNSLSFESQGKALVSTLRSKKVPVDSLFFNKNVFGVVTHEYQFQMNTLSAEKAFQKVLEFLSKYK